MATVERPDPVYVQIAKQIIARIEAGELAPGDPVPSARKIMAEWGVANATAAKVMRKLRTEGVITGEPGKNSVVARTHRGPQQYARSVLRRGRIYPEGHYAVIEAAETVVAPDRVTDALCIEPGSEAIRRVRVTYGPDDKPLAASVSWFDGALAEVAPLLLVKERILEGTTQYVANMAGRTRSPNESAKARASRATEDDARQLGIDAGSPVLRGRNLYWDLHGGVLEYGESTVPEEVEETFEYTVESEQAQ